jgi:hypothetical protein
MQKSDMFAHLHALKIEFVVRLRALGRRRNLIEGDNSFAFFIHPDGTLWGTAKGRRVAGGPLGFFGASTAVPGGATVPIDRWVTLTYVHDGFSTIDLFIDGALVASENSLHSPIQPVGALGVHIGNWPAGNSYPFRGDIDDVKIWRWDPDAAYTQFFARQPGPCWNGIFDELEQKAAEPEGRARLQRAMECMGSAQNELVRLVRSQGRSAIEANEQFSRRYRELWKAGAISGEDMKTLIDEWLGWLRDVVGRERLAEYFNQVAGCYSLIGDKIDPEAAARLEKCDPAFFNYIQMLMDNELT